MELILTRWLQNYFLSGRIGHLPNSDDGRRGVGTNKYILVVVVLQVTDEIKAEKNQIIIYSVSFINYRNGGTVRCLSDD